MLADPFRRPPGATLKGGIRASDRPLEDYWMPSRSVRPAILALYLLLICTQQAAAYTDPGSGALLLQILGGAAVGCLFYLRKILGFFGRKSRPSDQ